MRQATPVLVLLSLISSTSTAALSTKYSVHDVLRGRLGRGVGILISSSQTPSFLLEPTMRWITNVLAFVSLSCCGTLLAYAETWQVGFAKEEITPVEPLRLVGYSSRNVPHTGVADPLHVRVLTLTPSSTGEQKEGPKPLVLVSVECLGVNNRMTSHVAELVQTRYGVPRSHLVLSSTHSHTTPFFPKSPLNSFEEGPSQEELDAAERNQVRVIGAIDKAVERAFQNRVDNAKIDIGEGKATFAVQRRVLKEGKWASFGIQEGGQVDHRLFVLRVTSSDGKVLGGAYQYASHCTSLGPDFNQISGDWAGLSAGRLEQLHPDAIFLPIIGCGADANPNPRNSYEAAIQNSFEMTDSVQKVLASDQLTPLPALTKANYGTLALEPEQPTVEFVEHKSKSPYATNRIWGTYMLDLLKKEGKLPESVPLPIHVWQFGDTLNWVFLGGEVVVNYQYAIEKELAPKKTWVAAYCDNVLGYIASESQREEGGYEVDTSMIYYMIPGRWKSGTESAIVKRVHEISNVERN